VDRNQIGLSGAQADEDTGTVSYGTLTRTPLPPGERASGTLRILSTIQFSSSAFLASPCVALFPDRLRSCFVVYHSPHPEGLLESKPFAIAASSKPIRTLPRPTSHSTWSAASSVLPDIYLSSSPSPQPSTRHHSCQTCSLVCCNLISRSAPADTTVRQPTTQLRVHRLIA
jgi:hypothetical protein